MIDGQAVSGPAASAAGPHCTQEGGRRNTHGSWLLECSGQEDTIRIFRVVRERGTVREAEALVQTACGVEGRHEAGFEAEASVGALAGLDNDVLQHRTRHTSASMRRGSSHGFDFAVDGTELFQGATPKQLGVRPNSPERDLGLEQRSEIKRMHALGRRELTHAVEVFGEERADFGASEVIDSNLHDRSGLSACGPARNG